jgi:peptide/nickel transport system permease protein
MTAYLLYILRRFVLLLVTVYLSITVVFVVPRLVPGNPLGAVFLKMSEMGASAGAPELIAEYNRIFGLDKPLWEQYINYMRELHQGNLGYSISAFPSEVSVIIGNALPWTIGLLVVTTLISWILGSMIGAIVGWQGSRARLTQAVVSAALLLYTTPYYILAIILLYVFAFEFNVFPLSGAYSRGATPELTVDFIRDVIQHAMLPGLSIVLVSLGWWFLSMRSLITSLKGEDYILNAEAKGLKKGRILWNYAFRNALLPQTTGLAISLGNIVGGAIITEAIFAYPGIGWVIFNAIKGLDFPLIQGGVLLIILSVASANFIIDIAYPLLDPRIRIQKGRD